MDHLSIERILRLLTRLEGEPKQTLVYLLSCAKCRAKALSLLKEGHDRC
jgi:hypothetical protein